MADYVLVSATEVNSQISGKDNNALTALLKELNESNLATGKALDKSLQLAAVIATIAAHKYGNWKTCGGVLESLSAGARKNAMIGFFEEFAPVNWNEKNKAFVFAKKKRICEDLETGDDTFLESDKYKTMLTKAWTEFKPEPAYKGMNPLKDLVRVCKKMIERLSSGKEEDQVTSEQCKALITTLGVMGLPASEVSDLNSALAESEAKLEEMKQESTVHAAPEAASEEVEELYQARVVFFGERPSDEATAIFEQVDNGSLSKADAVAQLDALI